MSRYIADHFPPSVSSASGARALVLIFHRGRQGFGDDEACRLATRFFASIGRPLWTRWTSTVVLARDDRSPAHLCFFRVFRRPWNVYLLLFLFLSRSSHHTDSKTFSKPRRPFEKVRLDAELKTVGEYGLRNKRELWRVQFALNKLRNAARVLLTLDEDDPKRIFEVNAILKRMRACGLLEADKESLDYVLALTAEEFLERRLQTLVFKLGLAKSIHHARILIKQTHQSGQANRQRAVDFGYWEQKHIDFALNSPLGGGRPSRVKRRRMAQKRLPQAVMTTKRKKNKLGREKRGKSTPVS